MDVLSKNFLIVDVGHNPEGDELRISFSGLSAYGTQPWRAVGLDSCFLAEQRWKSVSDGVCLSHSLQTHVQSNVAKETKHACLLLSIVYLQSASSPCVTIGCSDECIEGGQDENLGGGLHSPNILQRRGRGERNPT